jgi:hypothetical protein
MVLPCCCTLLTQSLLSTKLVHTVCKVCIMSHSKDTTVADKERPTAAAAAAELLMAPL